MSQINVLFLLFVKLERSRRLADFASVQANVLQINSYVQSLGKEHILVFAYMYLCFSDASAAETYQPSISDNGVTYGKRFRRAVTDEEIAINEWSSAWYDRYSKYFFRALRQANM